jgi:hypothetical protein
MKTSQIAQSGNIISLGPPEYEARALTTARLRFMRDIRVKRMKGKGIKFFVPSPSEVLHAFP